ncbi:MAG: hypothetical protein DWH79_12905 [Planctomycetota bacterium]|nr:MAG: hypothetical protein DWH79_12905 [Planctomycetota bacterium]
MDLKLHRSTDKCGRTGRAFKPGDPMVSVLVRTPSGLERIDYGADGWEGPPEKTVAWWRSHSPQPESSGATLAPNDVLLDVIEQLDGNKDEATLRYLVALQLVRRRVLRIVDRPTDGASTTATNGARHDRELILACRKRDGEYRVTISPPDAATAAAIEQRLAALLWSGEAA